MPRNGSGSFGLVAGNPVVPSTVISSTWANNTLNDIASGLTQSLSNDGQTTPVANLPMATFRHTNVGNAAARTDYASAGQAQDSSLQWLTSVAGTDTITAIIAPSPTAYTAGQTFRFVAAGNNTGAATLNVNGLGAKSITKNGASVLTAGDIVGAAIIEVAYDGTQFQIISMAAPATAVSGQNRLINSNFDIWQRGTSFTNAANSAAAYTADCWQVYRGSFATGYTASRISGPANSSYAIKIQRNAADASVSPIFLSTSFETVDVIKFAGKTYNLSIQSLGNGAFIGATMSMQVFFGTGTDGNGPGGPSGTTSSIVNNFVLTSSYQRFSASIAVPSIATQCIIVFSITPSGVAGASDFFQYAQVQFSEGASLLPYERKSVDSELWSSKRYYNLITEAAFYGYGAAGQLMGYAITFRDMRVPPAVTLPAIGYTNAAGLAAAVATVSAILLYATITALGPAAWDTNSNPIILDSSL